MNLIEMIEKENMRTDIPEFKPGDSVKVHVRIVEGQKQRIQAFEGVCHSTNPGLQPGQLYGP
jgi:large subunit ribosomal protein L19